MTENVNWQGYKSDSLEGQRRKIEREISDLGLSNRFGVESGTFTPRRDTFYGKNVVGDTIPNENQVAIFAASQGEHSIVRVFIAPTEEDSGLKVDNNGRLYTTSFWTAADGNIRHMRPLDPVPLAAIADYTSPRECEIAIPEITGRFADATNHKQETKDILSSAEIRVPRGIHITDVSDDGDVLNKIRDFSITLDPERKRQIVFKPEHSTSQGDFVVMGSAMDSSFERKVRKYLPNQRKHGRNVLVEERLVPKPQQALADIWNENHPDQEKVTAEQIDYNFRVLLTCSEHPEVIDAEIRFDLFGADPVNVSKGAIASRLDVLGDPELSANVLEIARRTIATIYQHVRKEGDPDSISDMVGVDVLMDGLDPVIGEAQWGAGGIGTLTKLDGRPPASIEKVFIPSQAIVFERQEGRAVSVDSGELRNVPHNLETEYTLFQSLCYMKRYEEAEEIWYSMFDTYTQEERFFSDEKNNLSWMNYFAGKTGNYQRPLEYAESLIKEEPENPEYSYYRDMFRIQSLCDMERYEEAEEIWYSMFDTYTQEERFFSDKENNLSWMNYFADKTGNYQRPLEYAESLIKEEPENPEYRDYRDKFNRMRIKQVTEQIFPLYEAGMYEEAEEKWYEVFDDLTENSSGEFADREVNLRVMGLFARLTGHYQKPFEYLGALLYEDPENAIYLEHLNTILEGWSDQMASLLASEKYMEAEESYYSIHPLFTFCSGMETDLLRYMTYIADHTSHYYRPFKYTASLVKKEPENEIYKEYMKYFELKMRQERNSRRMKFMEKI